MKLRCIIVDDEPVARNGLAEDICAIDCMEVTGTAENALQAMELLTLHKPHLIFLDIEMPKLNGFDLLRTLQQPPMVILTTAYNHYAPESYDLGVIDYLLKPISFDRLRKACYKAKDLYEMQCRQPSAGIPDHLFVKCSGRHEKILLNELLFVEAADNYIQLYTTAKKYLVYQTLKNMEEILPAGYFIKVHKSYIVAVDKVDSINNNRLLIKQYSIPVSRTCKEAVLARIVSKKFT